MAAAGENRALIRDNDLDLDNHAVGPATRLYAWDKTETGPEIIKTP